MCQNVLSPCAQRVVGTTNPFLSPAVGAIKVGAVGIWMVGVAETLIDVCMSGREGIGGLAGPCTAASQEGSAIACVETLFNKTGLNSDPPVQL